MSKLNTQNAQHGLATADSLRELDEPVTRFPHWNYTRPTPGDLGLAVETLEEILQLAIPPAFLENDLSFSLWKGNPFNRMKQILVFQKVNRPFHNVSVPLLYGSIILSSIGQLLALGRVLVGSDALALQVTSIACIFPWLPEYADAANAELEQLFHVCPRLTKLKLVVETCYPSFSSPLEATLGSRITHLDTMRDESLIVNGFDAVLQVLAPSLLYVAIRLVLKPNVLNMLQSRISFLNLQHFILGIDNSLHIMDSFFSRWHFPILRRLTLKTRYYGRIELESSVLKCACQWLGKSLQHLEIFSLHRRWWVDSWEEAVSDTPVAQLFLQHCPSLLHWTTTPHFICMRELSHPTLQQIDILEDTYTQRLSATRAVENHFQLFPNCDFPSLRNVRMVSLNLIILPHVLSATAPYIYGPEPRVFYYPGICVVSTEHRLFTVQTQFSTDTTERYEREKMWVDRREDPAFTWVLRSLNRARGIEEESDESSTERWDEVEDEDDDSQDGDYVSDHTEEEESEYSEDGSEMTAAAESVLEEIQVMEREGIMSMGVEQVGREELLDVFDGLGTTE
ncbi:hypothetical protein DL96DRAFT_1825713 [Flagelloscypha sp. PMI_526]|nr:hypothetical protein DL96DRAFT_1825713 [Flagelloscypha sp. PMI_526]